MIRLVDVSKSFRSRRVLDRISCELTERRIGVMGRNGSGKSSLVRLFNGLLLPDSGEVSVLGMDPRRNAAALRRQVGFVFQNPDTQIIYPTVEEDIAFGLDNLGLDEPEKTHRIAAALEHFGMQPWRDAPTHTLSGGQKQLLALVSVLVMQPKVLVLDEPTTLLDLVNAERLRRLLADLPQQIVMVTHDATDLAGFERLLVIERGRVLADDTPAVALAAYHTHVSQLLASETRESRGAGEFPGARRAAPV